jgi:hypothetical protein
VYVPHSCTTNVLPPELEDVALAVVPAPDVLPPELEDVALAVVPAPDELPPTPADDVLTP